MKQTSRFALLNEFLLVFRRIILLYTAMFVRERAWLHVSLYLLTNLVFLVHLFAIRPFKEPLNNYWHIFNELTSLLIAYIIACINDPRYGPVANLEMGEMIVKCLFISWGINFLLVLYITVLEARLKLKRIYNRKLRNKCCCRKKPSAPTNEEVALYNMNLE